MWNVVLALQQILMCFYWICVSSAKVYIDKKLKRNDTRAPDDLIGDILQNSCLSKKELYAAITELQIGGVETVSYNLCYSDTYVIYWTISFWELQEKIDSIFVVCSI